MKGGFRCCKSAFCHINYKNGVEDENTRPYHRKKKGTRKKISRVRRNGKVKARIFRLEEYLRKKLIASGWK